MEVRNTSAVGSDFWLALARGREKCARSRLLISVRLGRIAVFFMIRSQSSFFIDRATILTAIWQMSYITMRKLDMFCGGPRRLRRVISPRKNQSDSPSGIEPDFDRSIHRRESLKFSSGTENYFWKTQIYFPPINLSRGNCRESDKMPRIRSDWHNNHFLASLTRRIIGA